MKEFRFQLGDIVATKSALAESKCGRYPKAFQVIETFKQTCPGGVQLHYLLRVENSPIRILEEELVFWADPAVQSAIDTADEYHDRRRRRESRLWSEELVKEASKSDEKEVDEKTE